MKKSAGIYIGYGWRIIIFHYAIQINPGIKNYRKTIFQLIIMDIGLPNSKDCLTLIKELKVNKVFLNIPIVCITSYDSLDQKANV